jgi:hypothetical protein
MKKFALSSLMILLTYCTFSQVFEIKSVGSHYSQEQIISAFNQADFCGSFFSAQRNSITLADGSIVELLNREELENKGINLQDNCFLPDNTIYYGAIWSITPEGFLMKGMNAYSTEKEYHHYNPEK